MIVFDAVTNHGRKIQFLNLNDKSAGYIKNNSWDSRDPINHDNKLYFVNDKHGIFNLAIDDETFSEKENNFLNKWKKFIKLSFILCG